MSAAPLLAAPRRSPVQSPIPPRANARASRPASRRSRRKTPGSGAILHRRKYCSPRRSGWLRRRRSIPPIGSSHRRGLSP